MRKETVVGLLAMMGAYLAITFAPQLLPTTPVWLAAQAAIGFLVCAFVGGAVARRGLVLPAAVASLLVSAATLYFMVRIAQPAGGSLAGVLASNWLVFLSSLLGAVAGALLGQAFGSMLAARRPRATI